MRIERLASETAARPLRACGGPPEVPLPEEEEYDSRPLFPFQAFEQRR